MGIYDVLDFVRIIYFGDNYFLKTRGVFEMKPCKNHRKIDSSWTVEHNLCKALMKKGYKQFKCKKCGYYSVWRKTK